MSEIVRITNTDFSNINKLSGYNMQSISRLKPSAAAAPLVVVKSIQRGTVTIPAGSSTYATTTVS